jgi:uncharacterized protein YodC (DUF2158 family)
MINRLFKPGDIVRFKNKRRAMVVDQSNRRTTRCIWFDKNTMQQSRWISKDCLELSPLVTDGVSSTFQGRGYRRVSKIISKEMRILDDALARAVNHLVLIDGWSHIFWLNKPMTERFDGSCWAALRTAPINRTPIILTYGDVDAVAFKLKFWDFVETYESKQEFIALETNSI